MMEHLKRGDNIDFIAQFDESTISVSDIQSAVLTVKNMGNLVNHPIDELVIDNLNNQVRYSFTQEETLEFKPNTFVYIELAILSKDKRQCVVSVMARTSDVLFNEVLT